MNMGKDISEITQSHDMWLFPYSLPLSTVLGLGLQWTCPALPGPALWPDFTLLVSPLPRNLSLCIHMQTWELAVLIQWGQSQPQIHLSSWVNPESGRDDSSQCLKPAVLWSRPLMERAWETPLGGSYPLPFPAASSRGVQVTGQDLDLWFWITYSFNPS